MRFYYVCIKIALVTYWESHWIIFAPPPRNLENRNGQLIYLLYFVYIFEKYLFEFVVLLTKIWPKNIAFCRYSYMLETSEDCFCPTPFIPRKD